MFRSIRLIAIVTTTLAAAGCSTMGGSGKATSLAQKQAELASQARAVLEQEMSGSPESRIPAQLVADARCVAVFPSVSQAGLVVGAKTGQGLVTCRESSGGFDNAQPAVFNLSGGSVGLQAGAQKSSVVLLFNTEQSVNALFQPEIKFGSQIQATAGPTGYDKVIARAPAPVVAYVTSAKGLFAGISVNGTKLAFDQAANDAIYRPQVTARGILLGQVNNASEMGPYKKTLLQFAPTGGEQSNSASGTQSGSGQQSDTQQPSNTDQQSDVGQQSQTSGSDQPQADSDSQPQPSERAPQPQSNSGEQLQPSGSGQQPQTGSGQQLQQPAAGQESQQSGSSQSQ